MRTVLLVKLTLTHVCVVESQWPCSGEDDSEKYIGLCLILASAQDLLYASDTWDGISDNSLSMLKGFPYRL